MRTRVHDIILLGIVKFDLVHDAFQRHKSTRTACLRKIVEENAGLGIDVLEGCAGGLAERFCYTALAMFL